MLSDEQGKKSPEVTSPRDKPKKKKKKPKPPVDDEETKVLSVDAEVHEQKEEDKTTVCTARLQWLSRKVGFLRTASY